MNRSELTEANSQSGREDAPSEWKWWASRDAENYMIGPHVTREAALEEARDYFGGEDGFWIVEAIQQGVEGLMPEAHRVIERELENAADDGVFGEDGDFELGGSPETQALAYGELDAALQTWFAKWSHLFPVPWRFAASRAEEWIQLAPIDGGAGVPVHTQTQATPGSEQKPSDPLPNQKEKGL